MNILEKSICIPSDVPDRSAKFMLLRAQELVNTPDPLGNRRMRLSSSTDVYSRDHILYIPSNVPARSAAFITRQINDILALPPDPQDDIRLRRSRDMRGSIDSAQSPRQTPPSL